MANNRPFFRHHEPLPTPSKWGDEERMFAVKLEHTLDDIYQRFGKIRLKDLAPDVRAAGRAAVKSFGVRSRFVHFEFFRLTCDQHIGKAGQVVALEVNMRPSGGYSPDMMNFANSTDVYKIWADMIAFDRSTKPAGEHYYCAYAGRRDSKRFALTHDALCQKYASQLRMVARVPEALSGAMSDQMYLAVFPTEEELFAYFEDVSREE